MSVPFSGSIFNVYFIYRALFADISNKVSGYGIFFKIFFLICWPLAFVMEALYGDFTLTTLPLATGLAAPLIYAIYLTFIRGDKEFKTVPHKVLGAGFLLGAVHCFNFSFFRDDPGSLIWGTTGHILLITLYGIGISNFYNYMLHKNENIRLGIIS